jgi:serine/threonine-protein kinase RsbW
VSAPRRPDQEQRGAAGRVLARFSLPSEPGGEREAMERVSEAVEEWGLSDERLERLKTAVAEATMNAMEHGNGYRPEIPVVVEVLFSGTDLRVRITDEGGSPIPDAQEGEPDLVAKLEGSQTPRGWGLFLIKNMVDEMRVSSDGTHHTVELVMSVEGGGDGG